MQSGAFAMSRFLWASDSSETTEAFTFGPKPTDENDSSPKFGSAQFCKIFTVMIVIVLKLCGLTIQ